MRLDGDQELTLPGVQEREVRQIALEDQGSLAGAARLQCATNPLAGVAVQRRRQVAPDGARVGAGELCAEIDAARPFTTVTVAPLCRAGRVRPGKLGARQLGLEHPLVDRPAGPRAQLAKADRRVGQDRGQLDVHFPGIEPDAATRLAGVEGSRQPGRARKGICGLQRQLVKARLQRVALQASAAAHPGDL